MTDAPVASDPPEEDAVAIATPQPAEPPPQPEPEKELRCTICGLSACWTK